VSSRLRPRCGGLVAGAAPRRLGYALVAHVRYSRGMTVIFLWTFLLFFATTSSDADSVVRLHKSVICLGTRYSVGRLDRADALFQCPAHFLGVFSLPIFGV